jgi:hypothetical protein
MFSSKNLLLPLQGDKIAMLPGRGEEGFKKKYKVGEL